MRDPVNDASPDVLKKAQAAYADKHQISLDQAAKLDPAVTLGNFYLDQYAAALDDMYKLRGLPYPEFPTKMREYDKLATRWKREQPANPFTFALPTIYKAILNFARADRELAAMTTVEALRAYAAANNGKLPAHLEDIVRRLPGVDETLINPFAHGALRLGERARLGRSLRGR